MARPEETLSVTLEASTIERLEAIAEAEDCSVASLVRESVEARFEDDDRFPPTVEVPTSYVREHERLELETTHLNEQVQELNRYIAALQDKLVGDEPIIFLDDPD